MIVCSMRPGPKTFAAPRNSNCEDPETAAERLRKAMALKYESRYRPNSDSI